MATSKTKTKKTTKNKDQYVIIDQEDKTYEIVNGDEVEKKLKTIFACDYDGDSDFIKMFLDDIKVYKIEQKKISIKVAKTEIKIS